MGPGISNSQLAQDLSDGLEVSESSGTNQFLNSNQDSNTTNSSNSTAQINSEANTKMAENNDDSHNPRLMRFIGKKYKDYNLWRMRAEVALKGKKLWKKLKAPDCTDEVKEQAAALLVGELGNILLCVCQATIDDPISFA